MLLGTIVFIFQLINGLCVRYFLELDNVVKDILILKLELDCGLSWFDNVHVIDAGSYISIACRCVVHLSS